MWKKIKAMLKEPKYFFHNLLKRKPLSLLPDKTYLKIKYFIEKKVWMSFDNPSNYNEKLQWLKLYNRKPEYTMMVDKYEVREHVAKNISDDILIPLYGVYENASEIPFEKLPDKFVIKPTHTSGDLIICNNKKELDINAAKEQIDSWKNREYYSLHREWPYKNVKPRVIVEKFLDQNDSKELRDYRFYCFNGRPRFVGVDFSITDKSKVRRNLYNLDWELMDERISYSRDLEINLTRPENFDKMIEIASKLAENIPHVRIDLYNLNGKIYFGEMTFFHQSGYGEVIPEAFNKQMGEWIDLPTHKTI